MNYHIYLTILFVGLSCHFTFTNAQFRVLNGEDIPIGRSPHSVAIIFNNKVYGCAGTLVSMTSVVTAAHCVVGLEALRPVVLAGAVDIREINRGTGQQRDVECIIPPPDYNAETGMMDIAVLKVERDFDETNAVEAILLCNVELVPRTMMEVSGWGSIVAGGTTPYLILQYTELPVRQKAFCQDIYWNIANPHDLASTIICAGCSTTGVCFGDSGAGALVDGRLCAVVQSGCDNLLVPALFTDVSNSRVNSFLIANIS